MSSTILSLIGTAWQLGVTGFLAYVAVCIALDHLFPEHEDEAEDEGAEYAEFDDADEFEGDAWDRALDRRRDEWEIAS